MLLHVMNTEKKNLTFHINSNWLTAVYIFKTFEICRLLAVALKWTRLQTAGMET